MVKAQGGNPSVLDQADALCRTKRQIPILAREEGYIDSLNAVEIGIAAQILGAGREKKSDPVDPAVGLVMHKRVGDIVSKEESIATLYVNDESRLEESIQRLYGAVCIRPEQPVRSPIVYDLIK